MSLIYLALGIVVGYLIAKNKNQILTEPKEETTEKKESLIEIQAREKRENLNRIMEMLESKSSLANDDVEKSLNVSDATATRYLEELEQQGKIQQVGVTGQAVRYEKI